MDTRAGKGKTALVTGASSGIGLEITRKLAEDGFDLVLVARDAARLADIAGSLSKRFDVEVTALPTDLARPGAAQSIHEKVRATGRDITVLVNNAGFDVYGPYWRTDMQDELDLVQVNVIALAQLTKHFMPDMIRHGWGRILNLGSTASFAPCPFNAMYGGSKAFVLSFSAALSEELAGTGVSVTALCPGPTHTRFAQRAGMSHTNLFHGRVAKAAAVAHIGYRAMMAGRRTAIAGWSNRLLVFSMRLAPIEMVARVTRHLMSPRKPAA